MNRAALTTTAHEAQPASLGACTAGPTVTRALERIGERLSRRLRPVFEPLVRASVRVEALPPVVEPYAAWLARQPAITALTLFCIEPASLAAMTVLDPATVRALVDRYFGGCGTPPLAAPSDFTTAEERMVARVARAAMASFAAEFDADGAATAQLRSTETNPQYAAFAAPDEAVATLCFRITTVDGADHRLSLILSQAVLRTLSGQDRGGVPALADGDGWRRQMLATTGSIHFEARVVVARPEISLGQLMRLKAGDVLPTVVPTLVPLIVAGRTLAHGTIGDSDGRAALRIERMASRSALS